MSIQEKELEKLKSGITKEVRLIFKANMKIFDWDIAENDDRKSAQLIVSAMREALDSLAEEIAMGKYDDY